MNQKNKSSIVKMMSDMNRLDKLVFYLSIYVVLELIFASFLLTNFPDTGKILATVIVCIDVIVCLIFLYDFSYRMRSSSNKTKFVLIHFMDILGSIPYILIICIWILYTNTSFNSSSMIMIAGTGVHKYARLFRFFRILRGVKAGLNFMYLSKKGGNIFRLSTKLAFLVLILCTLGLFQFEHKVNPNMGKITDCFWWSIYTMTDIGYEDVMPQTHAGKTIALILGCIGIALIGIFTAMLVEYFMQEGKAEKEKHIKSVEKKLDTLLEKLDKNSSSEK